MTFDLANLNLSNVKIGGSGTLSPGKHIVKVQDFTIEAPKSDPQGRQAKLVLADTRGGGVITTWLNIHLPKSVEATRIGKEQFKSLLHFGGHGNPDMPSTFPIKGLTVGVIVKEKSYVDQKTGNTRSGVEVAGFIDPAEIDKTLTPRAAPAPKTPASGLADEIPF